MEARAYVPPASPSAGFTISRNGPLPFEHDGRRKLYDRPPGQRPSRSRDITNRFDLPPPRSRDTGRRTEGSERPEKGAVDVERDPY